MNTITCILNENQRLHLKHVFQEYLVLNTPPYAEYQLKPENCTITAYLSGKVVFQGKDATTYAATYNPEVKKEKSKAVTHSDHQSHAGSDEVGTGDYFGPVCVSACFIGQQDIAWVKSLKVNDSKQLTDEKIIEIAPQLMERLDHSLLIVSPSKYNQIHNAYNMNQIKAILHNQAYLHLKSKIQQLPKLAVVDQFTPEKSYYHYLVGQKEIIRGLHFETKAESHYLAVACASMIARYAFLKSWEAMETQYEMNLGKGAGAKVDQDGVAFIKKYGKERLGEVAKLHFKNTEKIADLL